jgi:hypothetical protein
MDFFFTMEYNIKSVGLVEVSPYKVGSELLLKSSPFAHTTCLGVHISCDCHVKRVLCHHAVVRPQAADG